MSGLHRPDFERDGCGFGLMARMGGSPDHELVHMAIGALARLTHRGAVAADGKSGDGCGLLLGMPDAFMRAAASERGITLGPLYGVGMVFLNPDAAQARRERDVLGDELARKGLSVAGWREVPTDSDACGPQALESLPRIEQVFVEPDGSMAADELERRLYVARRRARKAVADEDGVFHVATLSARLVAYKGLVMPHHLTRFYPDLDDVRMASALCLFHQRFSTNTWPEWRLAQPFRFLAHNGELNTIQGNRNWAQARARKLSTALLPDLAGIHPWVSTTGSDSFTLDNMLEALVAGGMDLFRAMRILIPAAWQNLAGADPDLRAFYEYHSMHMEPWDGPAGIVLTDGRHAACVMDRNGLRPARYVITRPGGPGGRTDPEDYSDCLITLASESGVHDFPPGEVLMRGRLGPGEMLAADLQTGRLLLPAAVDERLKTRRPYRAWLDAARIRLYSSLEEENACAGTLDPQRLALAERRFGLSREEKRDVLAVLAEAGQEAVGSMGDDTPLAVMSRRGRSLYEYFRQQFAQVTNPAMDSLRERIVMSLETCFGREHNLFEESAAQAARLVVDSPVLSSSKLQQLLGVRDPRYACEHIALDYEPGSHLRAAIEAICARAAAAVRAGRTLILLSDRAFDPGRPLAHALLATGAVHHRLIDEGLRCDANILVETATARDPHHFAVLLGFGATAVHPYLAYASLCGMLEAGELEGADPAALLKRYRQAINKGLYKIMSKMGISTVASYRGAQLFEAVGLHREVVDLCFPGAVSRIQGAGFAELEADERARMADARDPARAPLPGGLLRFVHGGEYHAFNPDVVTALHRAVRSGDWGDYRLYAQAVNGRPPAALRDLLDLREDVDPVPLDEVEGEEALLPRFESGAMSLGAISPEAHETLARAMNRLGGRSNSGEGGEDPARYGTDRGSKIKQVASGRFGVTPHYLVNAEVLQIKIAQGAKPGEGGQLAGHKVNALIARLRYTVPGTPLISPPPHHDIYSIEDLAQLIFDLKQVNPDALVSVKLVSEPGVGTIAAGVAKAYADLITVAGHDGGTGASPLTSVRYAGAPWELGLAETQQVLRANGLRERVRLQTDGGLKTGLDVVKAALLGAESFGFGTPALVAMGCKYLRLCHLNNCATGVATQHEVLRREHFRGEVEQVERLFRFIAREVREWMARLGVRRFDELVGRTDLLRVRPGGTAGQARLDLGLLLADGGAAADQPRHCLARRNPPFDRGKLAERMVREIRPALDGRTGGVFHYAVRNDDRSVGARVSGEIARRYGDRGMEDAPVTVHLAGTAGQSLGAWNAGGLHLRLEGEANDYVGKGMAGGSIVLRPPRDAGFDGHSSVIMGNTCLYGATGGRLLAAGTAGERFAVRNSGAHAVVEGVGDHCCEYMTGGMVAVLGPTGLNFGAGMTGGFAFVLDLEEGFANRSHHEMVDLRRVDTESVESYRGFLRTLIADFADQTGSPWGRRLVEDFAALLPRFWLVKPVAADIGTLLDRLLERAE
jgi:glutamate synthase (NADPH/NADH) large chain